MNSASLKGIYLKKTNPNTLLRLKISRENWLGNQTDSIFCSSWSRSKTHTNPGTCWRCWPVCCHFYNNIRSFGWLKNRLTLWCTMFNRLWIREYRIHTYITNALDRAHLNYCLQTIIVDYVALLSISRLVDRQTGSGVANQYNVHFNTNVHIVVNITRVYLFLTS